MNEKRSVLSARCQAVVADLLPTPQRGTQPKPSLVGLPIYSSDGVKMGEVIGEGGMGVVRAAEQVALGLPVAVKTLKPNKHNAALD